MPNVAKVKPVPNRIADDGLPVFYECGCCGHYHNNDFFGDCREDSQRFSFQDLDAAFGIDKWWSSTDLAFKLYGN